ncbi:PREDICTED: autophagy-related protein 9A [Nicrophorus vespilloides]|uniref:Autophagy-related protein 9 n=1 Tax=Nicrophorus vespilloides TaxID=110193 RepID=A0ABM1MES8_NICVS|nr:PREDICTED: autophagy-related protein 9A [Nicrophorus vespilloides]
MQNYASLHDADQEESGVLFHVAEPSRARWNHIEDLDSFFTRLYKYHQRHGFKCMLVAEILELVQFVFICGFTTFLIHCVDYPVLFKEKPPPSGNSTKIAISDIILSPQECSNDFGLTTYIGIIIGVVVWAWRLVCRVYHLVHFWDVKQFYNCALDISDDDLDNMTWHEVQTRIRAVQLEQQMCIHKKELTELDIYHRILRQKNYLIAMTNKKLIPPRVNVPIIGEVVYWSLGLRYNINLLLFCGPWAPFENSFHLKEEYRKPAARHELARKLSRYIYWFAIVNIIFSPLVLAWQILYAFFSYADLMRREPGSLGVRSWSLYGRMYLRHFNELDHELQARLSRANRPATKYLSSFSSPLATIIARPIVLMAGSIIAVLIGLTVYDEDVLYVEHIITGITLLGALVAAFRALIPDETAAYCPEALLSNVLAHTHYLPSNWKGQAHTSGVRRQFQQLFQYRIAGVLEELVSPLMTPYILWKHIYPKSLDIVDFFRNFTVSVVGVGDVCSFAQMDVKKHGNPEWHEVDNTKIPDQYTQAEDGKTELSLIHFTLTNPSWRPPPEDQQFVEEVQTSKSMNQPQSSVNYLGDLFDSSIRTGAARAEGPLTSGPSDMSLSTIYLHDLHHRQVGFRQQQPHAIETTPLLSTLSQ